MMLVVITQSAKGSRNDENDSIDKAKCAAISKRSEHEESAKETKAGTPMDVYNMCIFIHITCFFCKRFVLLPCVVSSENVAISRAFRHTQSVGRQCFRKPPVP